MNTNKELIHKEYIQRETHVFHAPYNPEFDFYISVKNGDIKKVSLLCKDQLSGKKGLGELSHDPLRNIKYHFVITAALIARYCVEGGMEHETAYSLSDVYILEADRCASVTQVSKLHTAMSMDYVRRMKDIRKRRVFSKRIVKCIDYIYDNLHKRIRISELAQFAGLNPSYLSRLFKKETGMTVTEYIQTRKIETAKNMLKYSMFLPSQIAAVLAFPSQSYFIQIFKKWVGMTPKKYQDMSFRKTGIHDKT